jgi:hypothetical protein
MPATQASTQEADDTKTVRLHITPLKPELLKVYLAPSVLPLARNISYHTVETFPEKGYGYVELPDAEAQKIKKKLNGTTLKGSKVRIEMAKPEKRKAREEADKEDAEKPSKRAKKDKKEKKEKKEKSETRKREPGVFDGVELPDGRKVKRGWTEPASAKTKSSKDKKEKKSKDSKHQSKPSKYTKEPELLFKAKLEPVAATEHSRKEKKKDKKDKKERKTKTKEVVVHEFEKNTKTPSFLKAAKVSTEKKPPVEYVNGLGWVDEDGTVVEPETAKAAHSRVLQLLEGPIAEPPPTDSQGRPIVKKPAPAKKEQKVKKATPPPSSSSESDDESSVVSSSSEEEPSSSESESDNDSDEEESASDAEPTRSSPARAAPKSDSTSAPTASKEVHPLEALFKRAPPPSLSTPTKPPPINTAFSFFDNETTSPSGPADSTEGAEGAPTTPFTQRDLEWRGLRSAAPTPDTAAIGRRFSFDWRKGSAEADDDEEMSDVEAAKQSELSINTKANSQPKLAGVAEGNEDDDDAEAATAAAAEGGDDKPESEFRKWFWENRGDINRAWKKRRREALKAKRHADNRKMTGGRRIA